jgi:hypothetical protein
LDEGQVVGSEFVVTRRDPPTPFDLIEEPFNLMTLCLTPTKSDRDYTASATIRLAGPVSDLRSTFCQPVCCSHPLASCSL